MTAFDTSALQCEHLVSRFFNCLDERRFEELVALMAPEGCWIRLGVELKGRAAILKAMTERSQTVQTRHLVSNFDFTKTGEREAHSRCNVTVYRIESPGGEMPAPSIFVFEDSYRLLDGSWKIDRHAGKRAFSRG